MTRGSRRQFRGRSVAFSIKKVDGVERMVRKDDAGRTHAWTVASGLRHGWSNRERVFFTPCCGTMSSWTTQPVFRDRIKRDPPVFGANPRCLQGCGCRAGPWASLSASKPLQNRASSLNSLKPPGTKGTSAQRRRGIRLSRGTLLAPPDPLE